MEQRETRLKDREAQYRLLFENMVTGFVLHEMVCIRRAAGDYVPGNQSRL